MKKMKRDKIYVIPPKKNANLTDIAYTDRERKIIFRNGKQYAIVFATFYKENKYSTYFTKKDVVSAVKMIRRRPLSQGLGMYKIIDAKGRLYKYINDKKDKLVHIRFTIEPIPIFVHNPYFTILRERAVNALLKCKRIKVTERELESRIPIWGLYHNLDIEREIAEADKFLLKKNKTEEDYATYLSSWLIDKDVKRLQKNP